MELKHKSPPKILVETWLNGLHMYDYPEFREMSKNRIENVFGSAEIAEYYLFSCIEHEKDVA
ncbi:hypothetical protein CWB58_14790 [Pseudoalteromonas sp. S201]|uniref:hypothetical protein n=1 Tax=Pseudoalteromonas sp. S201 TaxID=579519 RepID=UPI00110D1B64|nr:hypothetical protein [Pseudoalteromonas sp. S201]TMS92350.1 hypothetical protein CWB58_14790 [Pseudoalteromonas sp. S201]